jgi:nitrite reductase (NADH) large subunit
MNRELDERGSALLQHYLETLGIGVVTGASIKAVGGQNRVEGVELTNGEVVAADILVVCAGVRANKALAEQAGLETKRGIIVDERMQTSDPNIFAVGDVAELPGAVAGLWAVGTAQAARAAAAIFGQDIVYSPPNTMVNLKMDGIDVKGYGNLNSDGDGEELMELEETGNVHRRLVVKGGRITGAVFVGPPGIGKALVQAVQTHADLSPIMNRLRTGDWNALGDV